MLSVCIFELRVTVNYMKILSVAQQCFYSKFMSPTKKKRYVDLRVVPDAVLK